MENSFQSIIDHLIEINAKANRIGEAVKILQAKFKSTEDEDILDFNSACQFLKVKPATLYKWTSQNFICYFKKGSKLYFSRNDLIEWVKSGRVKTKIELDDEVDDLLNSKRNRRPHGK